MEYIPLGRSGAAVSRLCFGSLTIGPLQAALTPERGAEVIRHALDRGVNFIDTAQYYGNYGHLSLALSGGRKAAASRTRSDIKTAKLALKGGREAVISSKTYAYDRAGAVAAVEEARAALDRDVIDIFMLHEQESVHTLRGHAEALDALFELKARGAIRAVGVSMHHIAAVDGVCEIFPLYPIDVIHPIYNSRGLGIADGNTDGMLAAMKRAKAFGIGIFAMKPLGGGHLCRDAAAAFDFVLDSGPVDCVAVGMQSEDEVDANVEYFERRAFPRETAKRLAKKERRLHIEDYCEGCGRCVTRCGQSALKIADGRAVCDAGKCVLCGYCSAVCPMFAIKVL